MVHLEELKATLEKELEKYAKTSDISVPALERVHKLTDTIKNICKIMALDKEEGSSHGMGGYYDTRYSGKRDSMGRYSRDEEMSRMGSSYDGYSRHDAKNHLLSKLGSMMEEADQETREILKDAMRKIER